MNLDLDSLHFHSVSMTLFRRTLTTDDNIFNDVTLSNYVTGISPPHHHNYWLGFTHAHTLTSSRDYNTVVIATTVDGEDWVGVYHGFKVVMDGKGGHVMTYRYYTSKCKLSWFGALFYLFSISVKSLFLTLADRVESLILRKIFPYCMCNPCKDAIMEAHVFH